APWTILMLRAGTTFAAALVIWVIWRSFSRNAPALVPGRAGIVVATLYGLGSIAFIMAVQKTSTAHLVFIIDLNSMLAALLSWIFLGERPRGGTLIAMAVMIFGVLIIVIDGLDSGNLLGNFLALLSSLAIASALTVSRHSGRDMGFTALVGVILPFIVA